MSKPEKEKRTQNYLSIVLMVLTILATLVTAVPGFLALKKDISIVVYEERDSEMLLVKGVDKEKIKNILIEQNLPDAVTTIKLRNIGNVPAKDVRVSVVVPGEIVAVESIPSEDDKPAWVDFVKEYDKEKDSSRLIYKINNLGVGPTFQIDLSYRKDSSKWPRWSVFSDGVSAELLASIETINEEKNKPLQKSIFVFIVGLLITILVTVVTKAKANPQFASVMKEFLYAILPFYSVKHKITYRANWNKFKLDVIENLIGSGGKLLVLGKGDYDSNQTDNFWDAVLELNGVKIGLDVHTKEQRWSGVIGDEYDQKEFWLKIISMSRTGLVKPVIVFDQPPWEDEPGNYQKNLEKLSNNEIFYTPTIIIGEPKVITSEIINALGHNTSAEEADAQTLKLHNKALNTDAVTCAG